MTTTKLSHPAETATAAIQPTTPADVDPLADVVAGTSTAALSRRTPGGLRSPLWRLNVTSDFGGRTHPVLGTRRFHRGIDYGARTGTAVRAAASGTVVWANDLGPYGTLVVIEHARDLHTAYGHLDSAHVSVGQRVRAGRQIGSVGSTGLATGPHLHFEVRNDGTPVNPTNWIDRQPAHISALIDAIAAKHLRRRRLWTTALSNHRPQRVLRRLKRWQIPRVGATRTSLLHMPVEGG